MEVLEYGSIWKSMLSYATKSIIWLLIQTFVVVSSQIAIQTSGQRNIAIRLHIHDMVTITIRDNGGSGIHISIWKSMLSYATKSILWLLIQTFVVASSIIVIQTSGQWNIASRVHIHEMVIIALHVNGGSGIWKYLEKYTILCYQVNSMTTHTNFCSCLIDNSIANKWAIKYCH
jgi:hypothetical protein